uniref:C2 domain-containing protein n=2 Tax=Ciona intestinalis TaxID=7719 RepID=F6TZQ9_CIOIN
MRIEDRVGLKLRGQLKLVVCGSTNKITVTILGLRSLPNTSSNNNQVYVKMSLSPEFESRLRHKTLTYDVTEESIAMHETFSFDICRRDSNRRVLVSVWMKNNERTFLLGCMSFGVRSIVTSQEITQGWYYLLKESLGRSKHLKFKFTKPARRQDPCRRSKSRDRMNRRRSARSDSSNSSLSSSLYRTKVARNTPRRYDIRHDDVNHVTSLKKRRRISNGFEEFKRPSINQSKAVAVGCRDNHHVNGLFVPKVV